MTTTNRPATVLAAEAALAGAGGRKKKKVPTMGPVRVNLEAFGVAILAAVLLKWFCIEAYQIPTSSMQPTLMGDVQAGVYDRILVDKLLPTIREPRRWDITVFKYPLQKNQNYVKRLVGMPGDRLFIGGGNLYQVTEQGGVRSYAPLRKPDDLQRQLWKDV
ncbi:MAG: signal peptidase I, partial [Planctomycetes bacterium]|nr:signal peptidase I [Planctomycetota bacterium]